jgi:hypothetical protein
MAAASTASRLGLRTVKLTSADEQAICDMASWGRSPTAAMSRSPAATSTRLPHPVRFNRSTQHRLLPTHLTRVTRGRDSASGHADPPRTPLALPHRLAADFSLDSLRQGRGAMRALPPPAFGDRLAFARWAMVGRGGVALARWARAGQPRSVVRRTRAHHPRSARLRASRPQSHQRPATKSRGAMPALPSGARPSRASPPTLVERI